MKKIVTFIFTFIMIILLTTSVQAKTTFDASWSSEKEYVRVGEDVVITLNFDNYTNVNRGFNAYKATLEYDESVFEKVSQTNFISLNNWEELKYNPETKEFVAIKKAGSQEAESVVQISLRIKGDTKAEIAKVKVVGIVTSEGKEDIYFAEPNEDVNKPHPEIKLNILREQVPPANNNGGGNNSGANKGETAPSPTTNPTSNTTSSVSNDNTIKQKPTRIPHAGVSWTMIIIPLLIELLIIHSIIVRKKDKKLTRKMNMKGKIIVSLFVVCMISMQGAGVIFAVSTVLSKGDINQDGKVDYSDVALIQYHLIHTPGKALSGDSYNNADMNNDGQLTVTDLTLLVQKIEKTLDYEISVSNVRTENYYPRKNDQITIEFSASAKYNARVTSVTINKNEYEVKKIEQSDSDYQVKVPVGDKDGLKTFNITKVTLYNGQTQKIDEKITVDVQKDMPSVSNYLVKEDTGAQKAIVSFDVTDNDNSLNASSVQILNKDDGTAVFNKEIKKGANKFEFEAQENTNYYIEIVLNYDLATNKLEQKQDCKGNILYSYDYTFAFNYNFEISNIKTYKNDFETNYFEPNEEITIKFTSSNSSENEPTSIVIDGKTYEVTKDEGGNYVVKVPGLRRSGTITIEEVRLSNGKLFELKEGNKLEINVTEKVPVVNNFNLKEDENNINVAFDLIDEDKVITTAKVVLFDVNELEVDSKQIEAGKVSATLKTDVSGHYFIRVIASYILSDQYFEDVAIFEKNITINPKAKITNSVVSSQYAEKEQNIDITYKISTNSNTEKIKSILVNNTVCQVDEVADGEYKVTYKVSNQSGVQELLAKKVIFESGLEARVENTATIEILKDAPKITNIKENDESHSTTLSFTIEDGEKSFISGKAVFTNTTDNTVQEQEVKAGDNTITFKATQNALYIFEIKVTYDRDNNKTDNKHLVKDKVLKTREIELIADYDFKINNINTYKNVTQTKYFDKNDKVTIKFESTNKSRYIPEKVVINKKEYNLTQNRDEYQVTLDGYAKSGIQKLEVEKVILTNSKEFDISKVLSIDVLKDKPTISGFKKVDNIETFTMDTQFVIEDAEKTFVSGKAILTNTVDNTTQEKSILVGENAISFDVKDDITYSLEIKVTSNRANDAEDTTHKVEETLKTEKLVFAPNYNLSIKEITTSNKEEATTYFEKNEKILVKFISNNDSKFTPKEIKIGEKTYTVIKNGNYYQAEIDGFATAGKHSNKITKIILSNGKAFDVSENIDLEVLKDKPKVSDKINVTEDINEAQVAVNFTITDAENSMTEGNAILYNDAGVEVERKRIAVGENNLVFNVVEDKVYTLKVVASYDRDTDSENGKNLVTDEVLKTEEVTLLGDYNLKVTDLVTYNKTEATTYFEKDSKIILKFNSTNNSKFVPKKVSINKTEYDVTKADSSYQVELNGYAVPGKQTIQIDKVILSNNKEIDMTSGEVPKTSIEVLKAEPKISNFVEKDDNKEHKAEFTFELVDADKTITKAEAIFTNTVDNTSEKLTVSSGANHIAFEAKEGVIYKLEIKASYDRDEDSSNNQNSVVDKVLETRNIQVIVNYNLQFTGLSTYSGEKETTYFEKNSKITLRFKSTNGSIFTPKTLFVNKKEYEIKTASNGDYQVQVEAPNLAGTFNLDIDKIVLSNDKDFKLEETAQVEVLKDKPTVSEIDETGSIEGLKFKISFTLIDAENTFISGKAILTNNVDNTTEEKEIKSGLNTLSYDMEDDGRYTLTIKATYARDKAGKNIIEDEVLKTQEVEVIPDYNFTITDVKTYKDGSQTAYFEKNENITLGFKSTNNSSSIPNKATINGKEYNLSVNGDRYQVQLSGYPESGTQNIEITSVTLSNNKTFDVSESVKVEVLKDGPILSEYSEEYNVETSGVTLKFKITDKEHTFESGKVVLTNKSDNTTQEKDIIVGTNTAVFTLEEDVSYTAKINVTYARANGKQNIVNETLKTVDVKLVHDYELSVTGLKAYKLNNPATYFNKRDDIKIGFKCTNNTSFMPNKAIINGKEVTLVKVNDEYQAELGSYDKSGAVDIRLEKIILQNEKQLPVNLSTKIEVLKDIPKIDEFSYEENEATNQIIATFVLHDEDNAVKVGTITVSDSEGNSVYVGNTLTTGTNTITFDKTNTELYEFVVKANYDLDTNAIENNQNEYTDYILLDEEIGVESNNKIEMKDIEGVTLYEQSGANVNTVTSVNISDLNDLSKYLVKVDMKELPSFYSSIKSYRADNGTLKFTLDYDNAVQYDGEEKHNYIEVEYGPVDENSATQSDLEVLIEQINTNPSGSYRITKDLDASKITEGQAVILQEFSGKLNGNGHTIKNLSRPLFASLKGATIENLVIQDASVRAYGLLAPTISSSTVRNVHLKDVTVNAPGANGTGSFAGIVNSNTVIENCSATNVVVGTAKRTGGLIGKMNNTTVRNCYISGKVSSNSDGSGGLIGEALSGSTIENCYVNVKTNFGGTGGSIGGVIGNPENALLNNTLSVATSVSGDGHGARMFGRYLRDISGNSTNNYELSTSNLNSNSSHKAVSTVEESALRTKEFYKDTLKWDENIWNFDNVGKGEYPTLKNSDPNSNIEEKPSNEEVFIPEYSRLKKLSNYDATREIAYHNIYKLMPFYDAKYLLINGNKISSTDALNTKLIKAIVPFDSKNQMIVGLTDKTKQDIAKIKIVFEDESTQEYTVTYKDTIGNIVNYEINDLKINYNYPKYLLKEDSQLITTLTNQVKGYTFEENLNEITSEDEDKRYKENFDNIVKENAREFVINLLSNVPEYNISIESPMLENKVKQELDKNNQLKKLLVAYNYFDRMYKIDIGGVIVRDTLFFDGSMFEGKLNPLQATNQFLLSSNRATNRSVEYYNASIKPYTKKASIADYLEYFIKNFAGYEDVTRWFPETYQGFVYEAPAKDFGTSVEYRAWNLMRRRQEIILATLTMPSDQMYVLSIPAQMIVGSIRLYKDDVNNPAEREDFKNWLKTYGELLGEYYNTLLKFTPNGEKIITNKISIHYDKRAIRGPIYQDPATTEDPFVKHFYGMIKRQANLNGTAAYANGTDVYWVANTVFFNNGVGNTGTFTHESAHNQDGYFHLLGFGRRTGAGGECFTDSVICQRMNIETIHFNAMYNHDYTAEIANNLTQERIDSTAKVEDFYKKMWETINCIDYMEAQAFLQCSPEVQSKIGRQYVFGTSDPQAAQGAKSLTAEEFEKMNLQTVEDLWDNQICIRVGATLNGDSLDNVYWYLPHNDNGVPEAKCFKRTAFEMLSVGGYKGGFAQYMSRASSNDLDAIKKITKDDTMTWKKYQMNKYQTVSQKINSNSYFDAEEMIQMFKQIMEEDAQMGNNVANARILRRYLYLYLQRATNDFRTGIYDEKQVVHINNGTEFVETIKKNPYGKYVLDADIDLTGKRGKSSITDVNFVGELDGNGHTISGIEMPIFNMIKFSNVYDLKLDKISILGASGGQRSATLARTASYSNFKNIHLVSGEIEGTLYIGGMIGEINGCFIRECTANVNVRATSNYAGGMIGLAKSSSISNSYTLGQVKGRQRVGGLIGSAGASYVGKCYSNSTVESTNSSSGGGFIGEAFNNTHVKNNIAFGKTKNAYKFDGITNAGMFGANYQNNYEYEESVGTTTLNKTGIDFTGKITSVNTATIEKQDFYTKDLHWDSKIWDFTNVSAGGLPKLKNLDSNNVMSVIEKIDISSVEDFKKIQEAPDAIYNITKDIDFSDYNEGNCVITAVFTGKIEGNGHTLSNLNNATLFNNFNGIVQNLNIRNFTNTRNVDYVTAFANNTNIATLKNMKFENITLKGTHRTAVVSGTDRSNSIFENISVKNANVTGSGVYVSTFIGRKYGGKITNCYVEGNLECYTTECGGLMGASQEGGQVSNVIANVNINRPRSTDARNNNGGMIGNIYNSPRIQNSISIGNMTGFRDNAGKEINVFKFIGRKEDNIIAYLENCYERTDATGESSITANAGEHLKGTTLSELKKASFYKDTLHFDDKIWDFTDVSRYGYPKLK